MPRPRMSQIRGLEESQLYDDMQPENLANLQQTMQHRDMQNPKQQAMLQEEKQRLMQVQAQRQFTQRLQQRMNPRIGTPEDSDPQAARAAFMARLMLQMKHRYPGMAQ